MKRLVLVLLDGLSIAAGRRCMSCLAALDEAGQASYGEASSILPPLSRPAYAALFSGRPPLSNGILHNDFPSLCPAPTIFQKAVNLGLVTAAAAYFWVSELCNRAPFIAERDRITDDANLPISHGIFYSCDAYPDEELFRDAEYLRHKHLPHLLLVHAMGIDFAGHKFGADSREYRDAARTADGLLARYLPLWLAAGYAALVVSDHGMDGEGSHYDATDENRRVPLWLVGEVRNMTRPCRLVEVADLIAAYLRV
ncbi:MAG: alkaline phosphatase family protein [Desulfovibrio sp.]|nr:alkaline phosphatase family protein [Desulfovibrio sp.]